MTRRCPTCHTSVATTVSLSAAPSVGRRQVRSAADRVDDVSVHVLDALSAGHAGVGPAIIEGPFFTARVLPGWSFRVTRAGDLLLTDDH
jgi:N-methylhydantoinase A